MVTRSPAFLRGCSHHSRRHQGWSSCRSAPRCSAESLSDDQTDLRKDRRTIDLLAAQGTTPITPQQGQAVAKEIGAKSLNAVAIAYVMQKAPYVFPIIGGRKVEHMMANIEALKIKLSDEQVKFIESVLPFDVGFPVNFIVSFFTSLMFLSCADEDPTRATADLILSSTPLQLLIGGRVQRLSVPAGRIEISIGEVWMVKLSVMSKRH